MSETDKQQVYIRLADDEASFFCTVLEGIGVTPPSLPAIESGDEPSAPEEHPGTVTMPCSFGDPASQREKDRWLSKFAGVLHESTPR